MPLSGFCSNVSSGYITNSIMESDGALVNDLESVRKIKETQCRIRPVAKKGEPFNDTRQPTGLLSSNFKPYCVSEIEMYRLPEHLFTTSNEQKGKFQHLN